MRTLSFVYKSRWPIPPRKSFYQQSQLKKPSSLKVMRYLRNGSSCVALSSPSPQSTPSQQPTPLTSAILTLLNPGIHSPSSTALSPSHRKDVCIKVVAESKDHTIKSMLSAPFPAGTASLRSTQRPIQRTRIRILTSIRGIIVGMTLLCLYKAGKYVPHIIRMTLA